MIAAGTMVCRCDGKSKVCHSTYAEAVAEMRRMRAEGRPEARHPLHIYLCPACRHLHVGGDRGDAPRRTRW